MKVTTYRRHTYDMTGLAKAGSPVTHRLFTGPGNEAVILMAPVMMIDEPEDLSTLSLTVLQALNTQLWQGTGDSYLQQVSL